MGLWLQTPLLKLWRNGWFKVLPPEHLSSPLPATFQQRLAVQQGDWLIHQVHVIPMDQDTIWPRRSVLIRKGIIHGIFPADQLPDSVERYPKIEGKDRFLIPGLSDVHTHLNDDNNLLLLLAYGVTLARNMSGFPFHLEWKRQLESGQILGPQLLTTTPILEGPSQIWRNSTGSIRFTRQEQIESTLDSLLKLEHDAVKVYHTLAKPFYEEICQVAASKGLPIVGHIPLELNLDQFIHSPQNSFEHLSIREMELISPKLPLTEAFARLAQAGKWLCPTLIVYRHMFEGSLDSVQRAYYFGFIDAKTRRFWRARQKAGPNDYEDRMALFQAFAAHSDRILSGSDCLNAFVVPGISLHEELGEMVKAGLSPYQALRSSTWQVAHYLQKQGELGSISVGKKARLVLLEANPLEDIAHTQGIVGIMMDGKWIDEAFRQEIIDAVRTHHP